jgi:hypothetical protein
MTKAARQATIRDILSRQAITSQEDLRRALGKSGFKVTQATLSRDMKELGVSRLARGGGRFEYSIPAEPDLNDLRPIVGAEVMGIDANEYLIVVRYDPRRGPYGGRVHRHPAGARHHRHRGRRQHPAGDPLVRRQDQARAGVPAADPGSGGLNPPRPLPESIPPSFTLMH